MMLYTFGCDATLRPRWSASANSADLAVVCRRMIA